MKFLLGVAATAQEKIASNVTPTQGVYIDMIQDTGKYLYHKM